ncbi:hypothetical protein TNCV_3029221 [Trichonephila clavipes]|nr:hypothetical protein TNCV_3029221 [Trichonephila clavipes]
MSTLKNSMLELAAKFDDNYNTGLIKSFMFGLNKTEIKTMTDILSRYKFRDSHDRWIPRGVSFQRPRHRLIAAASLGRLSRNRSIRVWFTRYPRTDLSDRWHSLGITSLRNIGGIRYVHIHSYIGHHDQACVLACKIQCISKFHEIKQKS